ncbi:MAG: hypothetical protein P8X42_15315, partial [Calditrichaceae bacterium]
MKSYFYIIFYVTVIIAKSQGLVSFPILYLYPPSASLNSAGGAFTALPTDDPFGFYYNPAQLGQFSQNS